MMNRIYHHYERLEEFHAGMWKRLTGDVRKSFIRQAADLMRDPVRFKVSMRQAFDLWPRSCEHNLTSLDSNRIAWLGHAGCCIETGSPEECTRVAWHTLTQEEQDEANRVAAEVLSVWDDMAGTVKCSKSQLELAF